MDMWGRCLVIPAYLTQLFCRLVWELHSDVDVDIVAEFTGLPNTPEVSCNIQSFIQSGT